MVVYTRIHLVIVSIHTPTQGVTTSIMYPAQASQFQSTHPRRVWPFCTFAMCSEYVSIHTPTQGVTSYLPIYEINGIVSIHTPTQGVTICTNVTTLYNWFQSTHPRRVWLSRFFTFVKVYVSIHTPTQGVTFLPGHTVSWLCFNPHTHAGCDKEIAAKVRSYAKFQSTHPRRVWHPACWGCGILREVSIHTPTQGVTY